MLDKYKSILKFYEDFKLHKGKLFNDDGFFDYAAPDSIHSWHTSFAYGIREAKSCAAAFNNDVVSEIILEKEDLDRRFYIKLTACLYLWRKYVCGIEIYLNGVLIHKNDEEFFENVNVGWPAIYYPIDSSILKTGENKIEIRQTTKDNALLVAEVDLLSLPMPACGQQLSCTRVIKKGEDVTLCFYTAGLPLEIAECKNCDIKEILISTINSNHTIVLLSNVNDDSMLKIKVDNNEFNAVLPEIVPENDDFFLLGIDSDDHRHDDSDETSRIMEILANTGMGNFWHARPKHTRNYINISNSEAWKKRVDFLRSYGVYFALSDDDKVMPFFRDLCGDNYFGDHCHEPYLYFLNNRGEPDENDTFGIIKNKFLEHIKNKTNEMDKNSSSSIGSPTPLLVYETSVGCSRVTIEPVASINLLMGAACASYAPTWGAHIPLDWYFGEPNDETKSKKLLAALHLMYMNDASFLYLENGVFKTNAFSRQNWENEFCARNRTYMREFFDYAKKHPRRGQKETELAVIYGNNDFFMWFPDSLLADGLTMTDPDYRGWTAKIWGKWDENDHQHCWHAIDAWLPPADNQNTRKNIINQELFSGTPYGSVDILPYSKEYTSYKSIAFLGWNTYETGLAEKLKAYLDNGGTAYISYCHFNKTDRSDRKMEYDDYELEKFFGLKICRISESDTGSIAEFSGNNISVFAKDSSDNALILKINIGKGCLYFGTFADYTSSEYRTEISKAVLREMAENTVNVKCSNTNIAFVKRRLDNGKVIIDLLNVNTNSNHAEKFTITTNDGISISGELSPCEVKHLEL